MQTIRKNATKKIEAILRSAVLIREYRHDDMGDDSGTATPERVMGSEFRRVWTENGVTSFWVHSNWTFTAYDSIEAARKTLTPQAFAKYFPQAA